MKARAIKKTYNFVLSIGMIVKNEEKYLRECLNALKPILENVKSELVIVDTGSTDKTVEIAKEFTEKVYFFEWIGDFAAARNFSLEKCSGEWFMFLDADEILTEGVGEMVEFFNDRKFSSKYNSAQYQMRDYTNVERTTWNINAKSRIIRLTDDAKFINPVHECFAKFYAPVYDFKTTFNHYGYIFATPEQEEAKRKRNYELLANQFEKSPEDLRIALMLFRELPEKTEEDLEKREAFLKDTLDLAKKIKHPFCEAAFLNAVRYYYGQSDYEAVVETANEYLEKYKSKSVVAVDIHAVKANALTHLERIDEALSSYRAYFNCYNRYREGKIDMAPLNTTGIIFIDKTHYDGLKGRYNEMTGQS